MTGFSKAMIGVVKSILSPGDDDTPEAPPPPKPEPVKAMPVPDDDKAKRARQRKIATSSGGRVSTILTGGLGESGAGGKLGSRR